MPASKSGDEPRKGIGLIRFLRGSFVTMQRDDRQPGRTVRSRFSIAESRRHRADDRAGRRQARSRLAHEVVAIAIYCKFWLPHAPAWIWIAGFSVILALINTFSIEDFGSVEYWFAMIKVVTIVAFLILGAMLLFGVGFPRIGLNNFTA